MSITETGRTGYRRPRPVSAPRWLVLLAALCALTATIPLVYLVVRTADAGIVVFVDTLLRGRVLVLTLNSVLLAVAVTASCLVLGTAVVLCSTRIRMPAGRLGLLLTALPLAVPSYLAAYGWLVAFPTLSGFFPSWLVMTAVCTPTWRSRSQRPYAGRPATWRPSPAPSAEIRSKSFREATLPRVRPAATAGALLVCLYTLSDFGTVSMLRFPTLTWGINSAYGATFDRNQAAYSSPFPRRARCPGRDGRTPRTRRHPRADRPSSAADHAAPSCAAGVRDHRADGTDRGRRRTFHRRAYPPVRGGHHPHDRRRQVGGSDCHDAAACRRRGRRSCRARPPDRRARSPAPWYSAEGDRVDIADPWPGAPRDCGRPFSCFLLTRGASESTKPSGYSCSLMRCFSCRRRSAPPEAGSRRCQTPSPGCLARWASPQARPGGGSPRAWRHLRSGWVRCWWLLRS